MSESSMRSYLVKELQSLHAQPIESPTMGMGIPDLNHMYGWIECKWLREWPKNCDTKPVVFDHPLMKEQGIWLWKRRLAGGQALVGAKVANNWFFWDGLDIRLHFNKMTRLEMIDRAELYFPKGLETQRLITYLETH